VGAEFGHQVLRSGGAGRRQGAHDAFDAFLIHDALKMQDDRVQARVGHYLPDDNIRRRPGRKPEHAQVAVQANVECQPVGDGFARSHIQRIVCKQPRIDSISAEVRRMVSRGIETTASRSSHQSGYECPDEIERQALPVSFFGRADIASA